MERLTWHNGEYWTQAQRLKVGYKDICAKLAAYETAEKQGRLVVLPCKVGEQVSINNRPYLVEGFLCTKVGQWKVHLAAAVPSWIGNQRRHWYMSFKAFEEKTSAEAEAALRKEQG